LGNLYVFFSNILHRVIPVKKGVRYSLVNWVSLKKIEGYKKTLL
jgi:predicted 2-oxoglutarate/Fe(II)-dependent dioxygenase YbiX